METQSSKDFTHGPQLWPVAVKTSLAESRDVQEAVAKDKPRSLAQACGTPNPPAVPVLGRQ